MISSAYVSLNSSHRMISYVVNFFNNSSYVFISFNLSSFSVWWSKLCCIGSLSLKMTNHAHDSIAGSYFDLSSFTNSHSKIAL